MKRIVVFAFLLGCGNKGPAGSNVAAGACEYKRLDKGGLQVCEDDRATASCNAEGLGWGAKDKDKVEGFTGTAGKKCTDLGYERCQNGSLAKPCPEKQ